jgi:serine/threonine protein kinase/formylglycine-generating enzyme required for sulfatase activity
MSGCPSRDTLRQLLDEKLPAEALAEVETHVEACTQCQDLLAQLTPLETPRSRSPGADTEPQSPPGHSPGQAAPTDMARDLTQRDHLNALRAADADQGQTLVLGEYLVLERIGAGGMGEVFQARHRRMDRVVALKILPPKAMSSPELVRRFEREVKAAARLLHPNIVTAFDAGQEQGLHFLVMEYVEGRNLAQIVEAQGPLPLAEALDCILQTARGMEYAHQHGVVHRDIKPANLLRSAEGTVKILDLGLARLGAARGSIEPAAAEQLTGSEQVMGTCDYMAPEQAEHTHAVDHRADIYSLGCTLYRLLTGKSPYPRDSLVQSLLAHREAPVPSLRDQRPDVPEQVERVFQKMLAKRPEDRQSSMTEVIRELESDDGILAPQDAAASAPTALGRDQGNPFRQIEPSIPVELERIGITARNKDVPEQRSTPGSVAEAIEPALADPHQVAQRPHPTASRPKEMVARLFWGKGGCGLALTIASLLMICSVTWLRRTPSYMAGGTRESIGAHGGPQDLPPLPPSYWRNPAEERLPPSYWRNPAEERLPPSYWRNPAEERIAPSRPQDLPALPPSYRGPDWPGEMSPSIPSPRTGTDTPGQGRRTAIAPFDATTAKDLQDEWAKHWSVPVEVTNSIGMRFVLIPPGEFMMGSSAEEIAQLLIEAKTKNWTGPNVELMLRETPKHRVKITQAFYLGLCEVTQAEYGRVMGSNPSNFQGVATAPAEQVGWNDVLVFCRKLSTLPNEQAARAVYRLPTEAEWEYACRAGTITRWYGWNGGALNACSWHAGNAEGTTHPVGQKRPNAWGLCDMHGNVWEWCQDWYGDKYYHVSPIDDPTGPSSGSYKVYRGGGWRDGEFDCRASCRGGHVPGDRSDNLGFRLARSVSTAASNAVGSRKGADEPP